MNRIRVLLVDSHAIVRQALRMFVGLDPEIEGVGEAAEVAEPLPRS
jgi:DNA-binding NarL/FixJ family response regulator